MSDDDIMHLSLKMRKHVLEQGKSAGQDMMSDHDRWKKQNKMLKLNQTKDEKEKDETV